MKKLSQPRLLVLGGGLRPSDRQLTPKLNPPPRRPYPIDASFLVPTQPRLPRLSHDTVADKINNKSTDDTDKCNRIHPMNVQTEDLHSDDGSPEVASQQRNIKKSSGGKPEHDWRAAVEYQKAQGVSNQVTADFAIIPDGGFILWTIKDARHGAVDEHTPEAQLAHNFIQGPLRHQEFLCYITHAVERCAHQCKQVPFELVTARDATETGALGDVITAEEDANATNADENADNLGRMVADV